MHLVGPSATKKARKCPCKYQISDYWARAKQLMMDADFCSMLRTLSALLACKSETSDPRVLGPVIL